MQQGRGHQFQTAMTYRRTAVTSPIRHHDALIRSYRETFARTAFRLDHVRTSIGQSGQVNFNNACFDDVAFFHGWTLAVSNWHHSSVAEPGPSTSYYAVNHHNRQKRSTVDGSPIVPFRRCRIKCTGVSTNSLSFVEGDADAASAHAWSGAQIRLRVEEVEFTVDCRLEPRD
jgi:hypothetical protein